MTKIALNSFLMLCTLAPACQTNQSREQHIEALIKKMVLSDKPAVMAPVLTPSIDDPRTDKRVIALQAADELREYGKDAFPFLLKHLNDRRQSIADRAVLPQDVALACYCIIERQIFPIPDDYPCSACRTGADGKLHSRPYITSPTLFDEGSIESWLKTRENTSLPEMQSEALAWLIEREKEIGFRNDAEREDILLPLERQLALIRGKR